MSRAGSAPLAMARSREPSASVYSTPASRRPSARPGTAGSAGSAATSATTPAISSAAAGAGAANPVQDNDVLRALPASSASGTPSPNSLSVALVREYLAARGFTKTLDCLKAEANEEAPISSRTALASYLGISKAVSANRASEDPLPTYLEVLIRHITTRVSKRPTSSSSSSVASASPGLAASRHARVKPAPQAIDSAPPSTAGTDALAAASPILGRFDASNPYALTNTSNTSIPPPPAGAAPSTTPPTKSPHTTSPGVHKPRQQSAAPTSSIASVTSSRAAMPPPGVALLQESFASAVEPPAFVARQVQASTMTSPATNATFTSSPSTRSSTRPASASASVSVSATTISSATAASSSVAIAATSASESLLVSRQANRSPSPTLDVVDIIDDLELTDDEDYSAHGQMKGGGVGVQQWNASSGTKVSPHLAGEIRRLLFMPDQVRGRSWFGEEWLGKGFVFRDTIDLAYGLVQLKGGPCGLLAAVQAHVIKNLVNATAFTCVANGRLRPTVTHARLALIQSIAEMAWQAGKHANRAVIVITSAGVASGDALTDSLEYHTFTNYAATAGFIESHISQFMTHDGPSHGIIQLLLSLILSRGVDRIRQDMDTAEQTLMGRHSYCTQDMVNLALMGAAISNLHDGDVHLGGDTVLKGVHSRADIGQLSLFEHYNNIRVGDHVKNPVHPIFVICSESHYTVLFGLDALPTARDLGHKTRFDVFYYDGLANQPEEIRLTVTSKAAVAGGHGGSPGAGGAATDAMYGRSAGKSVGPGRDHDDLEPPIELCLRTKWVNAHVDWNGTEPLL